LNIHGKDGKTFSIKHKYQDKRYAVVEWKDENSYGVIGMNILVKIAEEY
jgi:hypothetical protein